MEKECEKLLRGITGIVRECGGIILNADRSKSVVDAKEGHANFVTTYDKMIQEKLKKELLSLLPEAVFVGEEEDVHASVEKGYAFIVDPIDGTTNFIRDYHASAVSVGLAKDGAPYMGVVYNPYPDELFTAVKGLGAYLNGQPIHVSSHSLKDGIVIFGTATYYEELAERTFALAYDYYKRSLDVRRSGSAALDLCSIAAGRAELFYELRLCPWDYAAASLIVTEAGGRVTTVEGGELPFGASCSVMATNGVCG